jgi:hypothetical protein
MPAFIERFGGAVERFGQRLAGKPTSASAAIGTVFGASSHDRLAQYRLREMLYDNEEWLPTSRGGQLENILQGELGKSPDACRGVQVPGYIFPFARIVDAHQRLIPGVWGDGVKIAPTFRGRPVHPKLLDATVDPVGTTWKNSHLNTEKSSLLYMGPNYGTVGLRAVYEPADRPEDRRVSVHLIHPGTIAAYRRNLRGNVTYIRLESVEEDPDGSTHRIVEVMTEESFSRTRDGIEKLTPAQRRNPFPWVPVVVILHKSKTPGQLFGDHCYRGLERPVMGVNWSLANLLRSADQYAFAQVFMAAEGDAPVRVVLGNNVVLYNKLSKDGPRPEVQLLVPDIDFAGALSVIQEVRQEMRNSYPLMAMTEMKDLANQSGESKRQSMLAAKAILENVRPNYIDPVVQVMGMCHAYGILNSIPAYDVGTGLGTVDAADRAHGGGTGPAAFDLLLDDVIAETPDDAIVNTTSRYAEIEKKIAIAGDVMGERERLRLVGYDAPMIDRLLGERALDDVQKALAGGGATIGGNGEPE